MQDLMLTKIVNLSIANTEMQHQTLICENEVDIDRLNIHL